MKKFVVHFITNDYGVQTHSVVASDAGAAKKKAACWAKKATGWGDVPIIVETLTARKLNALEAGLGESRCVMDGLWFNHTHGRLDYISQADRERHIFEHLHVLMAQRTMFNDLKWNGAIGGYGA